MLGLECRDGTRSVLGCLQAIRLQTLDVSPQVGGVHGHLVDSLRVVGDCRCHCHDAALLGEVAGAVRFGHVGSVEQRCNRVACPLRGKILGISLHHLVSGELVKLCAKQFDVLQFAGVASRVLGELCERDLERAHLRVLRHELVALVDAHQLKIR